MAERSRKVARTDPHPPGNGSGNVLAPLPDDNDILELSASLSQTDEESNVVTGEVALGNSSRKQHLVTSPLHRITPILPEDDELLITKLCVAITRWADKVGDKPFNDIIHYLREPEFSISKFLERVTSVDYCRKVTMAITTTEMVRRGYSERHVYDSRGTSYGRLFMKSAVEVLQSQMMDANDKDIYVYPCEKFTRNNEHGVSNVMQTWFGREVTKSTRNKLALSSNPSEFWHDRTSSDPHFTGIIQIYSDKSATSLKSSAVNAYPVHITLLNFDASFRTRKIVEGKTILGYLPVEMMESDGGNTGEQHGRINTREKLSRAEVLNFSMEVVLQELCKTLPMGFPCETSSGSKFKCIPILGNYCADIPEAKGMTATSVFPGANVHVHMMNMPKLHIHIRS